MIMIMINYNDNDNNNDNDIFIILTGIYITKLHGIISLKLLPTTKGRISQFKTSIVNNLCNVAFNGNKSKLMFFRGRECVKHVRVSLSVNGNTIECETEADHLVHRVSSQDSDSLVKS